MVSVSNSAPDGVVTMEAVESSLLNKNIQCKKIESSHESALVAFYEKRRLRS